MKIKQIEITFNDDTDQEVINYLVGVLTTQLELSNITATILVQDKEVEEDIIAINDRSNRVAVGRKGRKQGNKK